jgi:predicted nucleic acid-binding Zn ribbon protein
MPSYTYKCEECTRELEITHSIHDDAVEYDKHILRGTKGYPVTVCNGRLKRLITGAPAISWKGGSPTPKFHE